MSRLLTDFFGARNQDSAAGAGADSRRLIRHFNRAFREPASFPELRNAVDRPAPGGRRRVVIVDGHPRSGKTWSALAGIDQVINARRYSEQEWWTSGVDSLKAFPSVRTTLEEGIGRITDEITGRGDALKLVLLDDLLGTNTYRPWNFQVGEETIARFFRWDAENPWIRTLAPGGVLVVTGRSLFFTLTEALLRVKSIRASSCDEVEVVSLRQGLFQTSTTRRLVGGFDHDQVREVAEANWRHHPLSPARKGRRSAEVPNREADWYVIASPISAFDPDSAGKLKALGGDPDRAAGRVLFGEDLDSLARQIRTLMARTPAPSVRAHHESALSELKRAYFFTVSPGLVFLGEEAFNVLRPLSRAREIAASLHYSDASLESGRLPNAFYMRALEEHLRYRMEFTAEVVVSVLTEEPADSSGPYGMGLGLRGLMERVLWAAKTGRMGRAGFQAVEPFAQDYLHRYGDALLHFEWALLQEEPSNPFGDQFQPGLVAAVGWCMYEFVRFPHQRHIRQAVVSGFLGRLEEEIARRATPGAERGHTPDRLGDYRSLIVIYSTFLQWVLKIAHRTSVTPERHPSEASVPPRDEIQEYLLRLLSLAYREPAPGGTTELRRHLQIVVEDEVLWARGKGLPKHFVPDAILGDFMSVEARTNMADEEVANRFFSLAWHNDWQEPGADELPSRAADWLERNGAAALALIKDQVFPEVDRAAGCGQIIHDNLRYHWIHFVTQRAAWMRDWCFKDDPDAFESVSSQIDPGAPDQAYFAELVEAALTNPATGGPCCIRHLLLLVGTRAPYIDHFSLGRILNRLDHRIVSEPVARTGMLQAIFELARQDQLDRLDRMDPDAQSAKVFCRWVRDHLSAVGEEVLGHAWSQYHQELSQLAHKLDLLPRSERGWEDILPGGWAQFKSPYLAIAVPELMPA